VPQIVVAVDVQVHGKTLAEVEAEVMSEVRRAIGPALQKELAGVALAVQPGACPGCGGNLRRRGMEPRRVMGLFGALELRRQRAECVACRCTRYPADEVLGLEAAERYTLGVAEAALWLSTESSYAKSSATMQHLLDVGISHGQIHRLAQKEGRLLEDAQEQLRTQVFGEGRREVLAALEQAAPELDLVVVQADGTFVRQRHGERMEAKAGIVYSRVAQVSKGRRLLLDKRTYAGVEDIEAFGEKLVLLAAQRGAFKAKRLWFVSDGADSLRRLRREHFPTATYFLDLWHLEHRIFEALGEAAAQERVPQLITLARAGKVDALITALTDDWAAAADDDLRRGLVGDLITYVDHNREGISNYTRHGPQASGAIEKTMDVAVGRRLKAKGTSWYRRGAHHLLTLRMLKQNATWNRYWAARRSRTSLIAAMAG
jgi:Uncharacterised protein family (UPF0236)